MTLEEIQAKMDGLLVELKEIEARNKISSDAFEEKLTEIHPDEKPQVQQEWRAAIKGYQAEIQVLRVKHKALRDAQARLQEEE